MLHLHVWVPEAGLAELYQVLARLQGGGRTTETVAGCDSGSRLTQLEVRLREVAVHPVQELHLLHALVAAGGRLNREQVYAAWGSRSQSRSLRGVGRALNRAAAQLQAEGVLSPSSGTAVNRVSWNATGKLDELVMDPAILEQLLAPLARSGEGVVGPDGGRRAASPSESGAE